MARGFGATLGVGTTDSIETATTSHATQRSYAIWAYRDTDDDLRRMFDKRVSGVETEFLYHNAAGGAQSYRYARVWTGGTVDWRFTRPATDGWYHVGVSYDGGSTSNDPVMYLDGVSQTVTESATAPSGSLVTNSDAYVIGNRKNDNARNWQGALSDYAIWNAILTADEFAALGKGVCPLLIRPAALIEYVPMIGPANSWVAGATTITGTAIQPHPRMHYPAQRRRAYVVPAAAGGRPALIGGKLTNSLLLGGLAR